MPEETIEETIEELDAVKITTSYIADTKTLRKLETPDKIVAKETVYNIEEIQAQIEKDTAARDAWQAKNRH